MRTLGGCKTHAAQREVSDGNPDLSGSRSNFRGQDFGPTRALGSVVNVDLISLESQLDSLGVSLSVGAAYRPMKALGWGFQVAHKRK